MIERSGVQNAAGDFRFHVKLFEAELSGASDVSMLPTLQGATYVAAFKRLVLDFDTLKLPGVGNVEGMSWGHRLGNGRESLVFVVDDNFLAPEPTQFLAFEVVR